MKTILKIALASVALITVAIPAYAEGDVKKGAKVFKKCKACHAVGEGAKNKIGPHLNGIIGRKAATTEGFKYSKKMIEKAEGGLIWTEENLDAFLKKPRDFVPGTKMAFGGIRKDKKRANLIAYLKTYTK